MLKELVTELSAGKSVRELCVLGDKKLAEETSKAFKKDKKVVKGTQRLCPAVVEIATIRVIPVSLTVPTRSSEVSMNILSYIYY